MSSRGITTRRAVLALMLTGVAACGFTPAFAPGAPTLALRNDVAVVAPQTIPGFAIRSHLIDRLGRADPAAYTLTVALDQALDVAALSREGDELRYNVVGAAGWTLTDAAGTILGNGQVDGFTSYSATGSTVATQAAATDAVGRLMVVLGDSIVADLLLLDLTP